jgi:hypothetical protein
LSSRVESARVTLKFLSPRNGKSKRRSPRRSPLIVAALLVSIVIASVRPVPMIPALPTGSPTPGLLAVAINWLTMELVNNFLDGYVVNGRRPAARTTKSVRRLICTDVASQSRQRRADSAVFAKLVTNLHLTIAAVIVWRDDESEVLDDGFMPSCA